MHFEAAAKLFAEANDSQMAIEAYLKYAECAEKENAMLSAADGYAQAANHEIDLDKAEKYLYKAKECYLIEGRGINGVKAVMKFLRRTYEKFEQIMENKGEEPPYTANP